LSNAPPSRRVLEIGSGNGLLLCELVKNGYDPVRLLGIDYSLGSKTLSRQVAYSRGIDEITFELCDFLNKDPPCISDMQEVVNSWDLLLDKGTFDAIALAVKDNTGQSPSELYPARVSRLLRPGGLFLITCPCLVSTIYFPSIDINECYSVQLYRGRIAGKICERWNWTCISVRIYCIYP
jgi:EEF1A lysine methyltransferase 2